MQVRYDERREIYRDCRWCAGKGCLYCKSEAEKAYRAAFPDGPKPLATFSLSDPADIDAARKSIGTDAIRTAFGERGGGIAEIIDNIAAAKGGAS